MTRRRDLEAHRDSLGEIAEILGSMKTLAYMETRKLSRFLGAQTSIVESIEAAAADFLSAHPGILPENCGGPEILLLIGTERGFCGDFNRALVDKLATIEAEAEESPPRIVAVGRKLDALLEARSIAALIEGASVAEDVGSVLQGLVDQLNALEPGMRGLSLRGVYQSPEGIRVDSLLPPFDEAARAAPKYSNPPLLNLAPDGFLLDLTEHYLLAALNHMLYMSLMVENSRRVAHLERAVQHIEDESIELTRKCRSLRQEEIVEEIEVILLSASSFDDNGSIDHER